MDKEILGHFQKNDPILFRVAKKFKFSNSQRGNNYFADLCEIIIQQQLSEKAGEVIFEKFKRLYPGGMITPKMTLQLRDGDIRNSGPSNSKIKYIKRLAQEISDNKINLRKLEEMKDEAVIEELVKLHGIGRWSAEMFLMFSLNRADVFSYGDLGLRKAIQKLYKLKREPTKKQAEKIANRWKPYRTYACRILWHSL